MQAVVMRETGDLRQSLSAQTLRGTEPRASTLRVITGLRPAAVAAGGGARGNRDAR